MKIYDITENAIKVYRLNAKRSKNLPVEVLKRKLTGLAANGSKREILYPVYKYTYGAFIMYINEETNTIENLYWSTEDNTARWTTAEERQKLVDTFTNLGLSKTGNALLTE